MLDHRRGLAYLLIMDNATQPAKTAPTRSERRAARRAARIAARTTISARVPFYWGAVAESFGLVEDDRDGHEGTREQFAAFVAHLEGLDRDSMTAGEKGSHTNALELARAAY